MGLTRMPPADPSLLPPGPRLPRIVQSIGMMRFRHRWVPWLQRRYGDVFTVRLFPSTRTVVVFGAPDAVREIFAGDPEVFHAGEANAILGPVMGPHSLLLVDGAEHRRARALLTPAFSGRALRGYADLVTGLARAEVAAWAPGRELPVLERMNALTLEVILRVVFGVTDEARLARLRPLVREIVEVSPLVFLGWALPRLRGVGMWRRAVERTAALDALVYEEIAARRASPDLATRTDVLSTLIRVDEDGDRLGDAELRDQLVTLLLAGHETTATALAWTLHEVGLDPALRARAREAARTGDDAVLEALVKEAMRLHPVIPMVVRVLRRPATVGGVDLPAGATVAASIILAHAREASHAAAGGVPPGPLPRAPAGPEHLDPLRRRGAALHRGGLLAHGGRRGAPRGLPRPRRRVGGPRGAPRAEHHERPAPRRPHRPPLTARPPRGSHLPRRPAPVEDDGPMTRATTTTTRRRTPRAPVAVVGALALALSGCTQGGREDPGLGPDPSASSRPSTDSPSATATSPDASPSSTSSPLPEGFSLEVQQSPAWPELGGQVGVGVESRVGRHAAYDRVVYQFTRAAKPTYRVRWVDEPLDDATGERKDVPGDAWLEVLVTSVGVPGESAPTPDDPLASTLEGTGIAAAPAIWGGFEGYGQQFIGVRGERRPFRVSVLTGPDPRRRRRGPLNPAPRACRPALRRRGRGARTGCGSR